MRSGLRLERVTEENVRAACQLKGGPTRRISLRPVAFSLADAYTIPDIARHGRDRRDLSWAEWLALADAG